MIEFNDELEQIEIKEYFSFENHVLPILNDIIDDLELEYENCHNLIKSDKLENKKKEESEKIEKFLNYKLTHNDKMEILHYIEDEYERSSNYFDNASIFDEHMIKECILTWITDNFEIENL